MGTPAAQPAMEAEFLRLLNVARSDPAAYGRAIGVDLGYVAPRPPLVTDARLVAAARGHSREMFETRYFDHRGRDGSSPADRAVRNGYGSREIGESIAGGTPTAESALRLLIEDKGVPNLGHRHQLLGHAPWAATHRDVGVGIWGNPADPVTGQFSGYFTIDTGTTDVPPPSPPPPPGTGGVTFLARDDAAKGDGVAKYANQLPLQTTAPEWTWAAGTTDPRAIPATTRAARCRFGEVVEGLVPAPGPGTLACYFVDYDSTARAQRVEILDPATRAVLDARTLTGFGGGAWLEWAVPGPVVVRLTRTAGANAVVSGVYFTPAVNG